MPPERELKILGSDVAGKEVLEIACGGGQSAVHLAERGARVTGVDFSSAQLAHARAFAKSKKVRVRFIKSNVENLSMLPDASFDIAFSAYALGFVEDIRRTFAEIRRVLRPGGLFAFPWAPPMFAITRDSTPELKISYLHRGEVAALKSAGSEHTLELNWYPDSRYRGGNELDHLAFECEDVRRDVDRLLKAGATMARPVEVRPKYVVGFVKDPDGIWLELYQERK